MAQHSESDLIEAFRNAKMYFIGRGRTPDLEMALQTAYVDGLRQDLIVCSVLDQRGFEVGQKSMFVYTNSNSQGGIQEVPGGLKENEEQLKTFLKRCSNHMKAEGKGNYGKQDDNNE